MSIRSIIFSCLFIFSWLAPDFMLGQEGRSVLDTEAPPQAFITGRGNEVCRGDSVAADITFLGDGPFDAVINDNLGEYLVLTDVSSPTSIWLKPAGNTTYFIASVKDRNDVEGTGFGSVAVEVLNVTPVDIVLAKTAYLKSDAGVPLVSSPAGGLFTGNGISGNVFYPSIAGPAGSPHTITCAYTNGAGCISTDTEEIIVIHGIAELALVSGADTISTVCDKAGSYELRGSNLDNQPGTFQLMRAGLPISVPGHISDPDLLDNTADFDPLGLSGPFDLFYTYSIDVLTVNVTQRITVNDLGSLVLIGFPDIVCSNDEPYLLYPDLIDIDPAATYTISGTGISGSQDLGYYFDPSSELLSSGENKIHMDYTSSNGCTASVDTSVMVRFSARADFNLSAVCLPVDGGMVDFTNTSAAKDSVDSWLWNFGDPGSGAENISTLENPSHFYGQPGDHIITLTAISLNGCESMQMVDTVLSVQPEAEFSWLNNCFSSAEKTGFVDRSSFSLSQLEKLVWTFSSESGSILDVIETESTEDTVQYAFSSVGNYMVELHIESEDGCEDQITKTLRLKPTIPITQDGYLEDFNGNQSLWTPESEDGISSWKRGIPDFTGFVAEEGDFAWYTDLPVVDTAYLENSWIEGPCFDFSGASSPLIQLDLMKSFAPSLDGAVLQYNMGEGGDWITLGSRGDGVNWYNATGIFNQPGGSTEGWGSPSFIPDDSWVDARHSLEVLAGNPHAKLRLAIATGSELLMGNQGFAFDNLLIAERVRRSVLEYFTNSSSQSAFDSDRKVDSFSMGNSANLIDLQYHTDYPGTDPMNLNNPYPPETRSFHFGVPGVPYAVLNGGVESDQRFDFSSEANDPSNSVLKQASLEIPLFEVRLQVNWMEEGLEADAHVTCLADTFFSNLQLYIAVIETSVTAYTGENQDTCFRNVVLDMLPTPAGKLLGNEWSNGKIESRNFTWDYPSYIEDVEDLAVVAFVQDRDQGSILQAAARYLTPQVSKRIKKSKPASLIVFPNPADHYVFVRLAPAQSPAQIRIMDLSGKEVFAMEAIPGYDVQRIEISELPPGLYVISLYEGQLLKSQNKLVLYR